MEKDNFKQDAKQVVDLMFDGGLFKEGITREGMNVIEDLIYDSMILKYKQHLRNMDFQKTINAFKFQNNL